MAGRTKIGPTLAKARATLHRAFRELHGAKDDEDLRQAAEKGWRAAREGVYAVMLSGGQVLHGTVGGGTVREFEGRMMAGYSTDISGGYDTAKSVLHGECFYDGLYHIEDRDIIEQTMTRVQELLDDCDIAISIIRSGRRKK